MNIDSVASPGREGVAAPGAALLRDIESTPPARALAALLWTLVALGATALVWALVGQLDIVATAPGRLVPFSQVKLVQSAEPGIVREILVRDGDPVTAGQVLLRLDATVAGADAAALAGELMLRRVTVRAIDAELAGRCWPARATTCRSSARYRRISPRDGRRCATRWRRRNRPVRGRAATCLPPAGCATS